MSLCENVTAVAAAPEGYDVDLCHPQQRAAIATYWCFGIGLVLSLLFTAQRLYVKLGIGTGWQVDDTLLALAWITSLVTQTYIVYGFAREYIGVHIWEMSSSKLSAFLMSLYVSAPLYALSGSCAKIGLSIFYLRLSPQRWFRYSIYATMLFIAGYSLGIFFAIIFACNPIARSYDVTVTTGSCINTAALYIATAVFNIASDIILFILPIPMVMGLQMKWKQKMGLLFIFGIGSVTIVTSIMRAVVLPTLLTTTDSSWDVAYASMLIVVEANLIIVCSMLPTLRKFFRHVAPKIIGESSYGGRSNNKSAGNGFSSKSPAIITFGSIPSSNKGLGNRGYAKFDRAGDEYAIALNTIGGTKAREGQTSTTTMVGVFTNASRKGRVDTMVMAGVAEGDETSGDSGGSRKSMSSRDSQFPIMKGATEAQSSGIKATTRIEVSYDVVGTAL